MSVRAWWRLSCGGFDAEGVSRCLGLRKFMFLFPMFSQKIWVREFEGGGVYEEESSRGFRGGLNLGSEHGMSSKTLLQLTTYLYT